MDYTVLSYNPFIDAAVDIFASGAFNAVLVEGMPGVGKTMTAPYIQKKLGVAHRFLIKPGHHEPYDFHGLPVPNHEDKATYFYPSADLLPPSDLKGGVLFVLDEVGDALTPIQNLCCQLVYEGGLHCYRVPENTFFLLTANRVADRSGAQRIVTKLANRVARFTLEPTVEELVDYGMSQGWAPSVLAFLKLLGRDPINPNDTKKKTEGGFVPTYFNSFDPNDPAQSVKSIFASSRTWEATSKLVNYLDANNPRISDPSLLSRVASLLGTPVATKYVPFRSEALTMPDPDAIAAGKSVAHPKKTGVMWTLTITLVSRATKANVGTIYDWLTGSNNREYSILFIKQCFDSKAAQLIGPTFNRILQEPDVKQALNAQ